MRRMSRRRFVRSLSRAAALAGGAAVAGRAFRGPLGASTSAASARAIADLSSATHQLFAPFVGTTFRIKTPDGKSADAVLTRVTALPRYARADEFRDPFSLGFSAAAGATLESVAEVSHADLGQFALGLHASGVPGSGVFEAVFG